MADQSMLRIQAQPFHPVRLNQAEDRELISIKDGKKYMLQSLEQIIRVRQKKNVAWIVPSKNDANASDDHQHPKKAKASEQPIF
jgi:hypothetical protein